MEKIFSILVIFLLDEEYRHISFLEKYCKENISGFGLSGYTMRIEIFLK